MIFRSKNTYIGVIFEHVLALLVFRRNIHIPLSLGTKSWLYFIESATSSEERLLLRS